jgi:hypothetical protein
MLAEDLEHPDLWRVEWFDSDGRAYITVFAGPSAGGRARDYHDAIRDGRLLIPSLIDQNSCAHWRNPRDMMRQG